MVLTEFLTTEQVKTIHRNALRVLAEIGVRVEHEEVRSRLAALGGQCDSATGRVRFSPRIVEHFISAKRKTGLETTSPAIRVTCGVYQSYYLDPATDEILPFDEERLAKYLMLAHSLSLIELPHLLGMPYLPQGIPAEYLPLAEKLFAWKHGVRPSGSVQLTGLCPPLLEMFTCHAERSGRRLEEVFTAEGFLVSPLKLARPECEQLMFFFKHGLRMRIGHQPSQGGTAPISLAGSIVLALAEQIFIFLLYRSFWDDAVFSVGGSVMTMDMRNAVACYGRPEQQRINVAFADIARFYGCPCGGHTGLSDAKRPSFEAGAQKAVGALITALATGCGTIEAGLLATDEICSPIQMILDHDLARSLRALLAQPEVNEAECAFREILAAGIGGNFLGTDFTFERFRKDLYQPQTWSWQMVSGWQESGKKMDVDMARDIFMHFESRFTPGSQISLDEERKLRDIIEVSIRSGLASGPHAQEM